MVPGQNNPVNGRQPGPQGATTSILPAEESPDKRQISCRPDLLFDMEFRVTVHPDPRLIVHSVQYC